MKNYVYDISLMLYPTSDAVYLPLLQYNEGISAQDKKYSVLLLTATLSLILLFRGIFWYFSLRSTVAVWKFFECILADLFYALMYE